MLFQQRNKISRASLLSNIKEIGGSYEYRTIANENG